MSLPKFSSNILFATFKYNCIHQFCSFFFFFPQLSENGHHTYSATLKGLLLKIATNMMTADRIAMIENRALASKSLFFLSMVCT